jgi:hypothetical protein
MTTTDVICPGCGLTVPAGDARLAEGFQASAACREVYLRLTGRTLELRDPGFVHQLAVDAYAAQHYGPPVKPITITFALVGLYLANERSFTGRQVQRTHMALARRRGDWPAFPPVTARAALTVGDVVDYPVPELAAAIRRWSGAVWAIWRHEQGTIAGLLRSRLGIE